MFFNNLYYSVKPFVPRSFQIFIRRKMVARKRRSCGDIWPIDKCAGKAPEGWKGWPEGKRFALVLTHDVDTLRGLEKCKELVEREKTLGFRSSFNFVPERYDVPQELREYFERNGIEVGVHDLKHDGKLFKSRKIFKRRADRINRYIGEWNAVGFRAGAMLRNLDWIHELDIEYDASTFDTDPFEPQPEGVGTIFPFYISNSNSRGYVELPYTLAQDFTLFILMAENNIGIWKQKLEWIVENGGMALFNTHPDYMIFHDGKPRVEEYPVEYYEEMLHHIQTRYVGQYWHVLPKEMAAFWLDIREKRVLQH